METYGRCAHCARRGLLTIPSDRPEYCDSDCYLACREGSDAGHREPTEKMLLNDRVRVVQSLAVLDKLEQIQA